MEPPTPGQARTKTFSSTECGGPFLLAGSGGSADPRPVLAHCASQKKKKNAIELGGLPKGSSRRFLRFPERERALNYSRQILSKLRTIKKGRLDV